MGWKKKVKKAIRQVSPPILVDIYAKARRENALIGGFRSWEEAEAKAEGYDKGLIFEKAKDAALAVKRGEALFERDTVLFHEPEYSHSISLGLLRGLAKGQGELNILDFGGALGSTYFNFLPLLTGAKKLSWGVIEQNHFVQFGRENLQDGSLRFFPTVEECVAASGKPNMALLSASIQYLRDYDKVVAGIVASAPALIVLDRVPILRDRKAPKKIYVQKVSEPIYEASYPCWAFNRGDFLGRFPGYKMVHENTCDDVVDKEVEYVGFVLERN